MKRNELNVIKAVKAVHTAEGAVLDKYKALAIKAKALTKEGVKHVQEGVKALGYSISWTKKVNGFISGCAKYADNLPEKEIEKAVTVTALFAMVREAKHGPADAATANAKEKPAGSKAGREVRSKAGNKATLRPEKQYRAGDVPALREAIEELALKVSMLAQAVDSPASLGAALTALKQAEQVLQGGK